MATDTTKGFDTLAYARRLKEVSMSDEQAEAHAEAVRDAVTGGVAAKTDIAELLADVRAEIRDLRTGIYRALWIQGVGIAAVMIGIGLFE